MLSHGISTDKAEIRIPEFKAAMRFWWRAVGEFKSLIEMREKEGEIFGDSISMKNGNYHASPFSMRTVGKPNLAFSEVKTGYTKNKDNKWILIAPIKGIKEGQGFQMNIHKRLNVDKKRI